MTLLQLRHLFLEKLKNNYSIDEVVSIYNLLIKDKLGMDAAEIVLNFENNLSKSNQDYFIDGLIRLSNNEPIQHLIGYSIFYDLVFEVNKKVLIPRPETEQLVDWIIQDVKSKKSQKTLRILDMGTGSGCIAISLAKNLTNVEIWALDVSEAALEIAKKNALLNEVPIHFVEEDILNLKTCDLEFDIIVSNPPYVRASERTEMHPNVLEFDPESALFVKDDNPLIFYNAIADLSKSILKKEGILYFEINQYLGIETVELLKEKGYTSIELKKDFLDNDRMIKARL